jgi:hypothetical protein
MPNPHARTVKRALEIVGSKRRLAIALDTTEEELESYINGAPMPTEKFIEALDIVAHGEAPPKLRG